ncbi:MAG TPA: methionyl-tRNA formyltransferase [Pyrinomonadaceae bacterium]|nr:methionyl-tRNA formyltransferase [Pyrinomonadaceae bacterium]
MKIVFMGTPKAAASSLERLIADGHEIAAVYTQPDRPAGRGNKIAFSPVKELAAAAGLTVLQPTKVKTPEAAQLFASHNADVAVVVAYGRILPDPFLYAFSHGAINVHFSLLPKYRGAAPVNWAIVNGETETGVTTMKMDAGLDTGAVLLQSKLPIPTDMNAIDLMDALADVGAELLSETLLRLSELTPQPQNGADASYAPILKKDDGLINWALEARSIKDRVRGFQPFPTSFTFYGGKRLTVWTANVGETDGQNEPGTIVHAEADLLDVACGGGSVLEIIELQLEGKRRMSARDFINGMKPVVGTSLGDL